MIKFFYDIRLLYWNGPIFISGKNDPNFIDLGFLYQMTWPLWLEIVRESYSFLPQNDSHLFLLDLEDH